MPRSGVRHNLDVAPIVSSPCVPHCRACPGNPAKRRLPREKSLFAAPTRGGWITGTSPVMRGQLRRQFGTKSQESVLPLPVARVMRARLSRGPKMTSEYSARLAPTPPMGWNSWNSFATTITEAQALETAAIMAAKLLPFGYDVFTIDIQWYEPGASSYEYSRTPQTTLDAYGRCVPAPNRFPSAKDGTGFTAIGEKVHALGLKFGIHIMRGIPRRAVEQNLPVLGSNVRAGDIADPTSICSW